MAGIPARTRGLPVLKEYVGGEDLFDARRRRLGLGRGLHGLFHTLHVLQPGYAEAEISKLAKETAIGETQCTRRFHRQVGELAASAAHHTHEFRVTVGKRHRGAVIAIFRHNSHSSQPSSHFQYGPSSAYMRADTLTLHTLPYALPDVAGEEEQGNRDRAGQNPTHGYYTGSPLKT